MKLFFLSILTLFAINTTVAQDIIKQNNGNKIEVKVTELADDYVKFYHFNDPDKVEVKMNRSLIKEIELEYGRKEETVQPGLDESYFVNDHINNVKVNFTSIANGTTILSYERGINPFSSWEGSLKLNGLGVGDNAEGKSGFGVEGGYKVKFGKLFKKNDYRPKHLLAGFFLKPGLGFNSSKIKFNSSTDEVKYNYVHGGIDIGNQWILNNTLSLEPYIGMHYYGGKIKGDNVCETCENRFTIDDGNMNGGDNTAGRFGINIGYTF